MEAVKFELDKHFDELCQWARGWDMPKPDPSLLPSIGRIIPGVCALFVYKTDSSLGFIENMVSNPSRDQINISEAIDILGEAILQDAKASGIKVLCGGVSVPAVLEHAKRNGYFVVPKQYQMVMKRLV